MNVAFSWSEFRGRRPNFEKTFKITEDKKMKKYSGFSDEQHKDCGANLNAISMIAFNLYMKISKKYGKSSKVAKQAERMQTSIDNLRALLDCEADYYYPRERHIPKSSAGRKTIISAENLRGGWSKYAVTAKKA